MKIAIVGYATEGVASAEYWHAQGHEITVCDQNPKLSVPAAYQKNLGKDYLKNLAQFDKIVRSAGINPNVLLKDNPSIAGKITTLTEEFMRSCPSSNIIGVTGTKGKGTTSTLIAKILERAGHTVHLGGNIGTPMLNKLSVIKPDDWVVLEISSFQLVDFKARGPKIGVCLMVVPEHLNWHASLDEYLTAKSRMFSTQSPSDTAIFLAGNKYSEEIASSSPGTKLPYLSSPGAVILDGFISIGGQNICPVDKIGLLGKHNWQNVCAAVTTVWQILQDVEAIAEIIESFTGLEHRLEFVRELDGVKYYDDSFSTTPETAIAAIEAFDAPEVLILGGSDKGISLEPLVNKAAGSSVKHIIAIGDTGATIAKMLKERGFDSVTTGLTTMKEIVDLARNQARPGDIVLLSTGCASFGLFKDYKDRGDQFKEVVNNLV